MERTGAGYTRVPNVLLEALAMARLSGVQMSICLFLLRRTCGWRRQADSITLREFAAACGSEETYIHKQLRQLVRLGVVVRSPDRPVRYALNAEPAQWLCLDCARLVELQQQGLYVWAGFVQNDNGCANGQAGQGVEVFQKDRAGFAGPGRPADPQNQAAQGLIQWEGAAGVTRIVHEDRVCSDGQGLSEKTGSGGNSTLERQGIAACRKKDIDLDYTDVDVDPAQQEISGIEHHWQTDPFPISLPARHGAPGPPEAAAAIRVQEALQQAGILAPSPVQVEKLTAWLKAGLELEVVLWAIEKAALANVRRVDYMEAICRNLCQAGVRTLEQARAESARFEARKKRRGRAAGTVGGAEKDSAARAQRRRLLESLYCN